MLPAPGAMRPCKSELYTTARSEVSVTECLDPDKDRAEDAKGGEADTEASDETLANLRLVIKEMLYKSSGGPCVATQNKAEGGRVSEAGSCQ